MIKVVESSLAGKQGPHGNEYLIPVKDDKKYLSTNQINDYVKVFLEYAKQSPKLEFIVAPIGLGLETRGKTHSGYRPSDIAWMFSDAPSNVKLPEEFVFELNRNL